MPGERGIVMDKNRLDAFDMIINVLREHEKNLDNLLDRLDILLETLSTLSVRLEHLYERIEKLDDPS